MKRIDDNTFKIVNAFNGNDKNVYVVDKNGHPTSEIVAQVLRPYDFLFTDDTTGAFDYNDSMCGVTFSLKDLTITGNIKFPNGDIRRIMKGDFWRLEKWCNQIYIEEILGVSRYSVIKVGMNGNKPIITSLRAAGNFVFESNMRIIKNQFPLIGVDFYYETVMKQVG